MPITSVGVLSDSVLSRLNPSLRYTRYYYFFIWEPYVPGYS
jgi:hypothetical protein